MAEPAPVIAVIGHFPDYLALAEALGARRFAIDPAIWDGLDDGDQWVLNRAFLDRCIADGVNFRLATPPDRARPASYFQRELEYLILSGYRLRFGRDGWEMQR